MLIAIAAATLIAAAPTPLTNAEVAGGWRVLFDGTSTTNFRGYKQSAFPAKGWAIEEGTLRSIKGGNGGDIITTDQFGDFEFALEYKCDTNANSGIMYRVTETADTAWQTGPEFQVLDDAGLKVASGHPHSAGALYDLLPPAVTKVSKGAGEWNHARVRLSGGLLQHYLNGQKVAECRVDGPDWKDRIGKSKFKDFPGFGVQPRGHIALQDHGDTVWYRNIKVRDLTLPAPGETKLWNEKDLTGFTHFLKDGGKAADVWSAVDGVLVCKGQPIGYLRTTEKFTNYVLRLSWRFSPVTLQSGNSGVLLRGQEPDQVWPKSIEAQLQGGSAGDFWNIDSFAMTTAPARLKGRNTKHTHANEQPVGQWNEYEIIVDGENVTLNVNGDTVNQATGCAVIPGFIALQSEGTEIHFKNIRIAPIAARPTPSPAPASASQ